MRIGRHEVPEGLLEGLKSLCHKTKDHLYWHYRDEKNYSYQASVNEALAFLESKGLNTKAALAVFCAVRYLTKEDLDNAWRKAVEGLESWLKERRLNLFLDCHFLQVSDEPHFVELSRAAKTHSHRKDPQKFPSLKTVEQIWDKIKLAAANQQTPQDLEQLEAIADREAWILLWDLNLSGSTIAKEIRRLERCKRILAPFDPQQCVHLLCQVSTKAAIDKITDTFKFLKLRGEIFRGLELAEHDNVKTTPHFSDDVRKNVLTLCDKFHNDVMSGAKEQPWLRDVGKLGYRDGGWLLATEVNCPNNSLPLLWFAPPNPEAAESRNFYKPPFPRIPSTLSHKSLAQYDLDSLTLSAENWFKEKIQSLIIHQVKHPSYDDRNYLSIMQARPKPWERTNHSDFKIRLQEVPPDEFHEIKDAIQTHYDNKEDINAEEISVIERIAEDTGSANFKITQSNGKDTILFRVNKRITDPGKIARIHALAGYFVDSEVLDAAGRKCLKPIEAKTPFPQGCSKIHGEGGGYLAAYRYAEADSHFRGQSPDELQSVAEEFAKFQAALANLKNARPDITLEKPGRSAGALNYYGDDPAKRYFEILEESEKRMKKLLRNWYDIPYVVICGSKDVLSQAATVLQKGMRLLKPEAPNDATAANLDLHPHNTLVKDKKCVLIYDFEHCYLQPNQEASLAFAVHRFTREWFIKDPDFPGYTKPAEVQATTKDFLISYEQAGGFIPEGFITRLHLLILWANFQKLLSIYDKLAGHTEDKAGRTPRTLVSELRKFVTYIQEADSYREWRE